MKEVGKYNLYKGISTIMTVGTPIITLACCSDFFVHRSDTAMSATAIFTILIACLFLKDKLADKMKVPSAFVLSTVLLILIVLVEKILQPMKLVCIATMITSGIDKLTFERMYKRLELSFPDSLPIYQFAGFILSTTDKIMGENKDVK